MSQADLLACPACRGELRERGDRLACAACGRDYPVRDGVPYLLLAQPGEWEEAAPGLVGRALAAVVANPLVYDVVQRLLGARETARRLGGALADADGALVLDVGAGTGAMERLLPPTARYLWLDPDPRKLAGFRTKSSASAVVGDSTALPLRDGAVDWAVSVAVSHHLDDEQFGHTLDELRRVTRERVVFFDAVLSPLRRSRLLWRYDRGRHPRPAEVLKRELASRFQLVSVEEFTAIHRYLLVVGSVSA